MLRQFNSEISQHSIPLIFPSPFSSEVHPLAEVAAQELQAELEINPWKHNFGHTNSNSEENAIGKMFGVLVVSDMLNQLGYLAAFSGKLSNSNEQEGFVPAVFNIYEEKGKFREKEKEINHLNDIILEKEQNAHFLELLRQKNDLESSLKIFIQKSKKKLKQQKETRKQQRLLAKESQTPEENAIFNETMNHQSKQEQLLYKKELKARKAQWEEAVLQVQELEDEIGKLKVKRAQESALLQKQLFSSFEFLNKQGESKPLRAIFDQTVFKIPPAGAGECAGPKLLQYAFKNNLQPICMTEFWWGKTPESEIRRHKKHYPACKGKCAPIFTHMLKGIVQEEIQFNIEIPEKLKILYEDESMLAVDKPAGLLSVPGKGSLPSVYSLATKMKGEESALYMVHRLDMDTSGILLIAKSQETYKQLQHQFLKRKVRKVYEALLERCPKSKAGFISLPLRPDILNRPWQTVCFDKGKEALTHYSLLDATDPKRVRVELEPKTGRTHQLRMHMAHRKGLNCPIIGDELYGTKNKRLFLHAKEIEFLHPSKGTKICLKSPCPF